MADPLSSPPPPQPSQSGSPNPLPNQPDSLPSTLSLSSTPPPPPSSTPLAPNPNFNLPLPPPPQFSTSVIPPPSIPSFRPLLPQPLQFSPSHNPGAAPNLAFQNPPPGMASGATAVPGSMPPMQPMMSYQIPPFHQANPAMRPFAPFPNGYAAPPAGIPRYPPPYGNMVRPVYHPRPPGAVNVLSVSRPPVAGIPGVRPIIPPIVRPVIAPSVTPTEMPQTPVYVGKIAPTVENEFMLSLLQLCGPIKSWKRPQDLSSGTPKGFGFYEFESAEGILRALRLLNKLNVDGQELMINVNQAMKEYLERYVQRKTENSKKKETQAIEEVKKDDEGAKPPDANQDAKPDAEHSNKEDNDSGNKESHDVANFGMVTDEDREADREASEKMATMIEERLKTRPLPPPPAQPSGDSSVNLSSDKPGKTRDEDSDVDTDTVAAEDKKETVTDNKLTSEHDRPETPDRRRHRERERDKEVKQEKQKGLERYEREAERERVRKERGQRRRVEEAESQYEACLKEWEYREREKEKEHQYEKEKEKERERKRRKEILYEEDGDEGSRKRWNRNVFEEKRRKRLREKEDDLADRQKEEEEIAEAKKRSEEEQQKQQTDALKPLSEQVSDGADKIMDTEEIANEVKNVVAEQDIVADCNHEGHIGDGNALNDINDELAMASVATADTQSSGNASTQKLGFGLVGSGKRTTVASVFHEEDDDDAHKDKKMRPLVPIDYSTEELQAVQPSVSGPTSNLAAAAEFAKRISNANFKEGKLDGEQDRSRRSNEKSSRRDRDRGDEYGTRNRDEKEKFPDHERDRNHGLEKHKTSDNRKLLDAKQLIDMIPKTKEELFSYEIDWVVYEKHQLHVRMRPWISKKIEEFLGEEENTLIDYIVSSTQEHVKATQMLERLQSILDDEAEMFVLKMWRMLIFEIKRVETGLASRSKS